MFAGFPPKDPHFFNFFFTPQTPSGPLGSNFFLNVEFSLSGKQYCFPKLHFFSDFSQLATVVIYTFVHQNTM